MPLHQYSRGLAVDLESGFCFVPSWDLGAFKASRIELKADHGMSFFASHPVYESQTQKLKKKSIIK